MSLNNFIIGKQLGKGVFGSVYLVTRKMDGNIYAMKSVNIGKLNKKEKESALNEIRILASLSHPNIIGYKEAFFDEYSNTLNIVMEYAEEGDLEQKIKYNLRKRLNFDESTIWGWIIQLLKGIKYLHDNKIMHRDLKSANIFIMKNGLLKLGDLNVSKIAKYGMAKTQTGTPYYCSPEIWKEKPYDYKSDIWSLGCIIYEICSLMPPFRGTSIKGLKENVLNGYFLPIPNIYSYELQKLIEKMLVIEPNYRASINELMLDSTVVEKMKIYENSNIFKFEENGKYIKGKIDLIKTIKLPNNIKEINSKLPKKKYNPEEEMMQNDEYETMKQTFFQNLKDNNNKNRFYKNKNKFNRERKSKNKNINGTEINKRKNINYNINSNKEKRILSSKNHQQNHLDLQSNKLFPINMNLEYQYKKAMNNNIDRFKKFNSKNIILEEHKTKNDLVKRNDYAYNNRILNKGNSEKNNLLIKNSYNKNYIIFENKNYSNNPYNLISVEENKINENKKENRYKLLCENEDANYNRIQNIKNPKKSKPQSAFHYQNNNIKSKKININNKNRPSTSIQSKKINRPSVENKNKMKINNLYDKYKNKNIKKEQNKDLKGFKYVPQKRQNKNIIYNKVNYNEYCVKNNIDKSKNYHYYKEKGYYNYRNAMKQYGNLVRNKISSNKKIKNENKFNNFIKNENKVHGIGYAAKLKIINNKK